MESVSPDEKGPTVTHEVGLSNVDATLDVIASSSGLVSSLSQGAFRHLRSAVRANTGAKAGRYYFEVQVLERVLDAPLLLLLGFSLDRSSLFLASSESVGFDSKGSSVSSIKAPSSTSDLGKAKRIGLLLDQDVKDGSVSVFLDGQQTRSVAIPQLHGKALFPTLTFQNVTLAVSFQAPGPERSRAFGQILEEHHVRSSIEESPKEVIIPVALPSSGLYDWSLRWREARPDFVEIGDEMMEDWSLSSGLSRARAGGIQSRDDPDMCFGIDELNKREAWHSALMCIARHSKRSLVHSSVRRNLLEVERTTMLNQFPAAKKIAVVLFGEPDEDLRDWVKRRRRSDYEAAKAQLQRRRNAAEAAGEEPPPDDLKEPCDDEVFLPNSKLEVTEQALQRDFQNFSLPSKAEGFDEIRYEWIDEESARAELAQWLRERKAKQVVEDLVPGEWFHRRCEEWKNVRRVFQNGQKDFCTRSQKDDSLLHVASSIDLEDVKDPHDVDGKGTPIYGNFKYEDWVVLSWRFEMHLLCHAFPMDAADPDRQGLPEEHLKHYWELYFHHHFEPRKLGVTNLQGILNVLKEPLTLKETKGGPRIVQSTLDKDTPIEAFVVAVEAYRRDRERRIEAGDESAALKIPRIAKAGPSAAVMKSLPKAGQNGPKVQSKEAAKMPKTSSAEAKENVAKAGAKPEAKPKQPSVAPPKGKAPNLAKVAVVKMPAKRPSPTDHGSAPKRPKPSVAMTK